MSVTGFGHIGRLRDYSTWGPTAQALSGLTFMSGLPGERPAGWGYSFLDHTAGYNAAIATLMAIHHRNRTGEGQWLDVSQVESGMVLTGPAVLDYTANGRPYRRPGNPTGNRSSNPRVAPHNAYRCAGDDEIVAGEPRQRWWRHLHLHGGGLAEVLQGHRLAGVDGRSQVRHQRRQGGQRGRA